MKSTADSQPAYKLAIEPACLVLVALLAARDGGDTTSMRVAGWAFTFGVLIFSGSLYLLVVTGKTWLGAITPIGGVTLLVGWAALALAVSRSA